MVVRTRSETVRKAVYSLVPTSNRSSADAFMPGPCLYGYQALVIFRLLEWSSTLLICSFVYKSFILVVPFVQEWEGQGQVDMSNSVANSVRSNVQKQAEGRTRVHEKADRATVEQVFSEIHFNDKLKH